MSRRLYQHERSAACRTVRWVLSRKGIGYEAVECDAAILADLERRFESSQLPLLEDGSHAVAGTRPIVFYLERTAGPPSVFPEDPQKRNQAVTFAEFAEQAIGTLTASLDHANENREGELAELRACLGQVREAIGRRALDSGACHFGDLAVAAHLVACQEIAELDFAGRYPDLAAYVARVRAAAGGD